MDSAELSFNPILLLVAILLTVMSSYTALDLFSLIKTSDRNKRFLFLGGTFSLGIGIWVMNFFGMLAINLNGSVSYQIPITILSIILGISFTAMAFYTLTGKIVNKGNLVAGSFFMMLAILVVHILGMYSMKLQFSYQPAILLIALGMVFASFYFSFWMLFFSTSFTQGNHGWIKPVSALVVTAAIVEGHFLLTKASSVYNDNGPVEQAGIPESLISYLIVFVSVLILAGLIGSSALISKRLAVSDTNLKDITDALNASAIVAITDPKGNITYVNDKFIEISKYSEAELLGENHSILNSGHHAKEFFKDMWRTIGAGKVWQGEIRNKAKDGSFYWVHTTIVPFLNSKGKPYQYVAIRSDITNRKQAEASLKETLKEVSDINFALDQSSIVAFTDEKGIIKSVNDKFCEISKYSREELIGKDHSLLNSGLHSKEFFKNLWKTIGSGQVWKGEIRNRAKDGSFYWVDTTIVPFLNENGKPYQYLAIRNDITEKKKSEEMLHRQDKLAAVGQLAAGVAHEIRNPLTSMKGYAEFLQLDEKDPQRQEFIEIILDEIDRVNNIVEEFMVLAKPKAVELEERNIIPIVQNVVSMLKFEARKRNVKLEFDTVEEIVQIECDENRLKQVFLNFMKNGIEAMPDGGDLRVKAEIHDENIVISIQDTGVGIPPETLKKIGEPFYTTKKNGNGLGLMVSFKIIESHNGKVYIESEQNKGTTFKILLPAKTA
ncbi:PAS domain S-box protein [Mesobacillus subterraneus]|uniref:PAS domain S-box protein n=1 Tax=Mesobacillus subterraneus TaxID=285983 RepID=UPI00203B1009|nr:PAS domain S-box protein [Mesobacillus subterraneus]MCM3664234.1 PAS domain S-box protein [Mesobacillus subterraneus]MCM3682262.1 PAS domain S-box protein [Mesobacillus subterraneus]